MSFQERRSLYNLVSSIIISVVFFIIINSMYNNGRFDTENMVKFWSLILLIYIGFSIVSRIILIIIHRILGEIRDEITGEKNDDRDIVDERDKLIELKSDRISSIVFMFAIIIGAVTQVMDYPVGGFFLSIMIGGFIGEQISYIAQIMYYRRGV